MHTLLSHNISVLSMSVDQVILGNPLAGLHGDADIEAGKLLYVKLYWSSLKMLNTCLSGINLPRPSLLFGDEEIDDPARTDVHDLSDAVSADFVFFSACYHSIRLIQSMLVSDDTIFDISMVFRNLARRFNLFILGTVKAPANFCYGHGMYREGLFYPHVPCANNGGLLLRILSLQEYINGPALVW
jgi:hypothetical protein